MCQNQWATIGNHLLSICTLLLYTILHFACHTVYVSLPHSFDLACHTLACLFTFMYLAPLFIQPIALFLFHLPLFYFSN